ncbi:DUF262 domain-containing protein [Burkholderia multivorans]|uniref:DUF262 domain-containing protein n=1 Tax=Burkholderia multivorans TaxID=87883 RepID=UPI001C2647DC|nr:DUF262 domain-containing protein [Burkholderia multivorans]MBU9542532.1 DUF262 domain-containing protein [Burkholderia multivorans]MCA8175131.1 DUF262 domain-containing protein [Burkholderia multivorans]
MAENGLEFIDEPDTELDAEQASEFSQAVLHSADWTVETIVSQLTRGNIEMNPRFQRRDAWTTRRKSLFVESLILGLPVPQIVLAEKRGQRGRYIVLDGKQRLLTLLQFTGNANGQNNAFRLSGLEARGDLARKSYQTLSTDPAFEDDLNALLNYTIRTVVIRNWPSYDFLHLVFLRLNTGSVKLSPQELRQAMFPGEFSDYVDDAAGDSQALRELLGKNGPDPRMRDVELLVRFLAFHYYLPAYGGRMKDFLDQTCEKLNDRWAAEQPLIQQAVNQFEAATRSLMRLFGPENVARKTGSKSFNRAVFDALVFYAADERIRNAMLQSPDEVRAAYNQVIERPDFLEAAESDTAGVPNTLARLRIWGESLRGLLELEFMLPEAPQEANADAPHGGPRITFNGLWGRDGV